MTGRVKLAGWLLLIGAANLAACSSNERSESRSEDPFGFVEIRALAKPLAAGDTAPDARLRAVLQRERRRVAQEYGSALTRFTSIYGEGFGPVRGLPEYESCKAAFGTVKEWIGISQAQLPDTRIRMLWARLEHCGIVARGWAGPAETATFGDDLGAMVAGSTMVLGYTAASDGSALGARIYQSAAFPVRPPR